MVQLDGVAGRTGRADLTDGAGLPQRDGFPRGGQSPASLRGGAARAPALRRPGAPAAARAPAGVCGVRRGLPLPAFRIPRSAFRRTLLAGPGRARAHVGATPRAHVGATPRARCRRPPAPQGGQ